MGAGLSDVDDFFEHGIFGRCTVAVQSIVPGNEHEAAWNSVLKNVKGSAVKKLPNEQGARTAFRDPSVQQMEGLKNIMFVWKTIENQDGPLVYTYINSGYIQGAGG